MKTLKYTSLLLMLAAFFSSCSKMDDYKKFTNGKEILYSAKADSVKLFPGRNRAKLSWNLIADPKIVKTRVYWNNRTKFIDVPISFAVSATRTISVIVPDLAEGNYNFELFTFDKDGNSSVVSLVSGSVYGEIYEKALLNRIIKTMRLEPDGSTSINWLGSESTSAGVELSYINKSGTNQKVKIPRDGNTTLLTDYNPVSPLTYRTAFLPDSNTIDTFYTANSTKTINEIGLKNPGSPFIGANISGRWGNLKDWTANAAAQNHSGVGGFDNYNGGGYISFEYWGTPSITNGKVTQKLTLAPGNYRFVITISEISGNCEAMYTAIALGNDLPNVENISSAIASYKLTNNSLNGKDVTASFTLTETREITLGFVGTMLKNGNTSLRINKVRLFKD